MILWLASYPKSGNTYLRTILSAYFFSKNGEFTFDLLKNIQKFPSLNHFKSLNVNCNDEKDIFRNYIRAQEDINKKKKQIIFLKTHSSFCKIGGYQFTDQKNTLGAIYVIRDPRNVALSMANYFSCTNEQAVKSILNPEFDLLEDGNKNFRNYLGTWSFHFNSWKRQNNVLIIKYEDLVSNPKTQIYKVFDFMARLIKSKINIDEPKLTKSIDNTKFQTLKRLEKKIGFAENLGRKNDFFNRGVKNDFKKFLEPRLKKEIEIKFKKDLDELGYL